MLRGAVGVGWSLCVCVALAASAALADPEPGTIAPTAGRAQGGRMQLSGSFSLGREHDDNVIQLTRANLDLFATRPGPPRFLISRVGDWATIGEGTLRFRDRLLPHRDTRAELDAGFHRYDHDRVVDWQQYDLSLAQELTASHRHLLSLEAFLGHIPNYYLGEITDLDESVAAGTRVRNSLTYEQTRYGARLRQELLRGRFAVAAGLERIHRGYNRHFQERVNDNDQWQLQAEVVPVPGWDASARIVWLTGALRARGDLPDTLGVRDTDISYDHDGIGAAVSLPWGGRGRWRGRLDGSFQPEVRSYTTTDKFDILRFGRENHRRDARVRVSERLWGPLEGVMSWSRLTSRAEFHQGITFPAEQTNFAQEQFEVLLRARWELAR